MRCELNIRRGETGLAALFCDDLEPELENESASIVSRAVAFNTPPTLAAARYAVLINEDEDQIPNVATMVLGQAGYEVIIAKKGDDAIRKYQKIKNLNRLLIDLIMPDGISGNQLIVELRKSDPDLPAVVMSGYAAEITSGDPFLSKLFSMNALLEKIRELTLPSEAEKS